MTKYLHSDLPTLKRLQSATIESDTCCIEHVDSKTRVVRTIVGFQSTSVATLAKGENVYQMERRDDGNGWMQQMCINKSMLQTKVLVMETGYNIDTITN